MSKLLLLAVLPIAGAFTHNLVPHHATERLQQVAIGAEGAVNRTSQPVAGLTFMHVPFNFGHTVEGVASYGQGIVWGSMYPALQATSDVTGCPLYYTPPKYWPEDVAAEYLGSAQLFGILRDPYERLVSMFRGGAADYGGAYNHTLLETCDVDKGIQEMLDTYMNGGNPFASGCTLIPQAEFFEGDRKITLPVDNRLFPHSVNAVFADHGIPVYITQESIAHVVECQDSWAADLSPETRKLIREVYQKDFELLCSYFGYCDSEETLCLKYVNGMCPETVFRWNDVTAMYVKQ